MPKQRLDLLLVERGLAESRNKASALILAGRVLVADKPIDKAGTLVPADSEIRLRGGESQFVSRGGGKIDPVIEHFGLEVAGLVAVDVGASTGGFTDSLLQRGASRVYAVDVGYNQLDYRLRSDPRVVVLERTNAKDLKAEQFVPPPSLAVMDLSFIGLRKVLPAVSNILDNPCAILCLVKPQFELGPEFVEKGGVVRDTTSQQKAVQLVETAAVELGFSSGGSIPSPLRGGKKGNQEFFIYLTRER